MTTTEFVAHLDRHGLDPRTSGNGRWRSRCPGHDNRRDLTLSITEGDDGRTVVYCFAGCTPEQVCDGLGLTVGDLFDKRPDRPPIRPRPKPVRVMRGADLVLDLVLRTGGTYRPCKNDGCWNATCPCCGERTLVIVEPSHVDRLDDQWPPVALSCFCSCELQEIRAALWAARDTEGERA